MNAWFVAMTILLGVGARILHRYDVRRVLIWIAFVWFVPGALLLGLIAAIFEAIPIVGPLLGAIPAILVAGTVSSQLALVVAGVYVVIQLVEGSVLVPLVMRNTIGISPLLVLLSLLVGAAVGGLVGAFLAVPIAASLEMKITRPVLRSSMVLK